MMANRSKEWSEDISKKLKRKSYRRDFFIALIEDEHLTVRDAMQVLAKTMGLQEFSDLVNMKPSNISRIINPKNEIRTGTLEIILRKIGCVLSVKAA